MKIGKNNLPSNFAYVMANILMFKLHLITIASTLKKNQKWFNNDNENNNNGDINCGMFSISFLRKRREKQKFVPRIEISGDTNTNWLISEYHFLIFKREITSL